MLDIRFIRDNRELIEESARKRHLELNIDGLFFVDDKRKEKQQEVDDLRAKQNEASKMIASIMSPEEKKNKIDEVQGLKENLKSAEEKLREIMQKWQELMLLIPNIPDMSVPEGRSEKENQEAKQWGKKTDFSFEPKDHIALMSDLGLADFERGVKVHGFRGYFLKGDGALLSLALWNYARDFYLKKGFEFVIPPAIVKKEFFYGTGHLPSDAEDLFATQDGDFLSGTSEVPLMAYYAGEIVSQADLPKKFLAFSPCYRREAGSYGKDTKGLMRVHEFYKWEQLVLCEADHKISETIHEELTGNMEEFIESLELPYRRTIVCAGDLTASKVKQYETELWIPSLKEYREIGSSSYYHDFQSRRFNIRYNDAGKKKYVHSLNATALPTPRILIALLENNQQADGSVSVPGVLKSYFGKDQITSSSSSGNLS
jgi:seryl-tRNA synthetase